MNLSFSELIIIKEWKHEIDPLTRTRISPDLYALNFNENQLENVVDGLLSTGDVDADGKIREGTKGFPMEVYFST